MRLALHQAGEVATRAGRILLAERSLTAIGLVDKNPTEKDSRLERAEVLATYDALITDDTNPQPQIEAALVAGISCVVWVDADGAEEEYGDAFAAKLAPLGTQEPPEAMPWMLVRSLKSLR